MTGLDCDTFTFLDILNGALDDRRYEAVIISYALHLVKESMLHAFCSKLAEISKTLIIISPHKFPKMTGSSGWTEVDTFVLDRVHFRAYHSYRFVEPE